MKLTILGCHSATPRWDANPTSQVLEMRGHLFLVDCGEGTQMQLRRNKVKFSRIKHIFISHLHGDHFFGLVGLISTFRLLGREADLHVYGPKGIKQAVVFQLKIAKSWTNYSLFFHELESTEPELIFEDDKVSVETIPLDHRVYTNGFLFKEKPKERTLDYQAAQKAGIHHTYFQKLKQGEDVESEKGETIPFKTVTDDPPPIKSYAFCSDTAYFPQIVPQIKEATVLYHESTFLESHHHLCDSTKHSTAKEAGVIAKKAKVRMLILGHYSGRYSDRNLFKKEAEIVFPKVELAEDGKVFDF
ncbi:ribonuclease Z [Flavobacteriaceae bacterium TK19130]|nr:ribonuclease Z [Thermobacterium salinum]